MSSFNVNGAGGLLGIEVSSTGFAAVAVDENLNVVASHVAPADFGVDFSDQLVALVGQMREKGAEFKALGIAIPGLVNHSTNRIAFSAHLPEQAELDFLEKIENGTGIPVIVENDANAAAFGEYVAGAGRGSENAFYVTVGEGVGGALILGGKIWRGAAGYAGEFGYLTINSEGVRLEDVAAAKNIVRRVKERLHQDQTSSLIKIGEEVITIDDIIREANNGDGFSQMMLERTGNYVGTGIAGVINLLNIEKIIVGGSIVHAGSYFLDAMISRASELAFEPAFVNTEILAAEIKEYPSATGAAFLAANAN